MTKDEMDQLSKSCTELLEQKFIASKTYTPKKDEWLAQQWEGIKNTRTFSPIRDTGVPLGTLRCAVLCCAVLCVSNCVLCGGFVSSQIA